MAAIGVMTIGKVDAINKESIQTRFFVLVLPLFPIESFYYLGNSPQGKLGIRIPLNIKSIALGYLRWWVSIISITLIFLAFAGEEYSLLAPGIIGIFLFLSTFWLGRLSKNEMKRRRVLVNTVGLGADPRILPKEMVQETMTKLEKAWQQATVGTLRENWKNVTSLSSADADLYPLLYCLALYAGENQLAERAWQNLDSMANALKDQKSLRF